MCGMEYNRILLEKRGGIAVISLNDPDKLNAFSVETLRELLCVVRELETDAAVRVVIVTGVGKAFVAGADIGHMRGLNALEAIEYATDTTDVYDVIGRSKKVYIAAVNGFALGGGAEFALACDIRVASAKAKFGLPEVSLGILPGGGGTQRLPRLVGSAKAMELILTGKIIAADEALRIGLVNQVTEPEALMDTAFDMAAAIVKNAPIAVALAKECIVQSGQLPLEEGIGFEKKLFGLCFSTEDQKEGMAAFEEKRSPRFQNK